MCKVSIIVPVYNAQKHILETMSSLVNQTLSDIEIICVDDGSSDNSALILDDIANKDARVVIIKNKNSGPGVSRNIAVDKAKGKYLLFVDSDDILCLDACELLVQEAEATNSDLLIGKYNPFVTTNEEIVECKRSSETIPYTESFTPYLWDKMWNRDFFITNRLYNLEQFYCEDQVSVIKAITCSENINNSSLVFYNYRNNPDSIMNQKIELKHTQNRLNALTISFDLVKHSNKYMTLSLANYFGNSLFYLLRSPIQGSGDETTKLAVNIQNYVWKKLSLSIVKKLFSKKTNVYLLMPSFLWKIVSWGVGTKLKN